MDVRKITRRRLRRGAEIDVIVVSVDDDGAGRDPVRSGGDDLVCHALRQFEPVSRLRVGVMAGTALGGADVDEQAAGMGDDAVGAAPRIGGGRVVGRNFHGVERVKAVLYVRDIGADVVVGRSRNVVSLYVGVNLRPNVRMGVRRNVVSANRGLHVAQGHAERVPLPVLVSRGGIGGNDEDVLARSLADDVDLPGFGNVLRGESFGCVERTMCEIGRAAEAPPRHVVLVLLEQPYLRAAIPQEIARVIRRDVRRYVERSLIVVFLRCSRRLTGQHHAGRSVPLEGDHLTGGTVVRWIAECGCPIPRSGPDSLPTPGRVESRSSRPAGRSTRPESLRLLGQGQYPRSVGLCVCHARR